MFRVAGVYRTAVLAVRGEVNEYMRLSVIFLMIRPGSLFLFLNEDEEDVLESTSKN